VILFLPRGVIPTSGELISSWRLRQRRRPPAGQPGTGQPGTGQPGTGQPATAGELP
jgi:hypothetical protein